MTATVSDEIMVQTASAGLEPIDAAVDEVVEEIRTNGVTAAELERAQEALIAAHNAVKQHDEAELANRCGWRVVVGGSISEVDATPAALAKVTTDDIKNAAIAYLDPRRSVTGWFVPGREHVAKADVEVAASA